MIKDSILKSQYKYTSQILEPTSESCYHSLSTRVKLLSQTQIKPCNVLVLILS